MNLSSLDKFHKSRTGYLVFGLVELALAYVCFSWAVDSGRVLAYCVALIVMLGVLQIFVYLVGGFVHGRHYTGQA
jgi:hypothetical protein